MAMLIFFVIFFNCNDLIEGVSNATILLLVMLYEIAKELKSKRK